MGLCSFACDLIDITGSVVVVVVVDVVVGEGKQHYQQRSASLLNLTHGKYRGCFGFRLLLKREAEQETERHS